MKRSHEYPELDLFSEYGENVHVEKVLWDEFPCEDVLTNDPSELNITIRPAGDRSLIDLSRAQFAMKVQIVHKDGTALALIGSGDNVKLSNTQVGPVDNGLHSMIEDLSVYLNDIELSNANKLYPFKSYLLDYFDTSEEQKKSYMTAQLWYQNQGDNKNSFDATINKGLVKRSAYFGTYTQDLIGKLHSELFNQERYLINGVEVKVKLTLAKPKFFLQSNMKKDSKPVEYKIKIKDARMYVPYVHLSETTMEEINETLEDKPAVYEVKRILTKSIPVNAKTKEHQIDDISKGRLPNKIIAGFISTKAKQGEFKTSPFVFYPYKLKKIELKINGMPYSKRALTPDYATNDYTKTYMNLFESLNYIEDGANTPLITKADFKSGGNTFYAFNLNPSCHSDPGVFKKSGNVSIYLEFEDDTVTDDLQMIVMSIYDNSIKIDKDRNFTKDW